MDVGQYFAYKRYFNTIIEPWDLSRIVDNGLIYILTEYNVFWTDLARSGSVRLGPARSGPVRLGPARSGPVRQKIGFLTYLIAPGAPGPLESYSASKNTLGDLSTASDRGIFIDFRMLDLCFVVNAILSL